MEYKELLRQMIIECKNDADSFLSENKQDYLYCKERNERVLLNHHRFF